MNDRKRFLRSVGDALYHIKREARVYGYQDSSEYIEVKNFLEKVIYCHPADVMEYGNDIGFYCPVCDKLIVFEGEEVPLSYEYDLYTFREERKRLESIIHQVYHTTGEKITIKEARAIEPTE